MLQTAVFKVERDIGLLSVDTVSVGSEQELCFLVRASAHVFRPTDMERMYSGQQIWEGWDERYG